MDLSPNLLLLVVAVSCGSAIVGGMGGFGTGIILTATLTPILGIKAVVPLLALAGIIINMGRFWFYRRDFDVRAVQRCCRRRCSACSAAPWSTACSTPRRWRS